MNAYPNPKSIPCPVTIPLASAFITPPIVVSPAASFAIASLTSFIPPIPVCTINVRFGSGPSNSTLP